MQFEASEHVDIVTKQKDKQIREIQERLSETYQQQQQEIDSLTSQVRQLQTDLQLKHSYSDNLKLDNQAKFEMLEGHLAKMKDMLSEKTQLNEDIDS